jgi:hypothetical protein
MRKGEREERFLLTGEGEASGVFFLLIPIVLECCRSGESNLRLVGMGGRSRRPRHGVCRRDGRRACIRIRPIPIKQLGQNLMTWPNHSSRNNPAFDC